MIDYLNENQGVIAIISLIVSVVIAAIGFKINKNVNKIINVKKGQDVSGNNSKAIMAGGNVVDKSIN